MKIREILKRIINFIGYTVVGNDVWKDINIKAHAALIGNNIPTGVPNSFYDQDGVRTFHNHEFVRNPSFINAYKRGVKAQGRMKIIDNPGEPEYHWHWRVHIGLWAAFSASKLEGDYVECGVNRGFLSSSIMEFINWNSLGKSFYLLDTFKGIDLCNTSKDEKEQGIVNKNRIWLKTGFYVSSSDSVSSNFSEWENVHIIEGSIPDTLNKVESKKICFLHIDMNNTLPEVASLEYFWDRLVSGAFVLFDDYAYKGYRSQKLGLDVVAKKKGVKIVSLPTGQGLLIKPPN